MKKPLKLVETPRDYDPSEEARANFTNYVQAVAFQISLSRGMIQMLGYVRDHRPGKWKTDDDRLKNGALDAMAEEKRLMSPRVVSHFVPYVDRLIKRGLVWHDYPKLPEGKYHPIPGHAYYKMTRAGELVCELLVEAGLLPEKEK